MRWPKGWTRFALNRRVLTDFRRMVEAQERQATALEKLVEVFAPTYDTPKDEPALRAISGVSYSRDDEQVLILDYTARIREGTGHTPTDEEIAVFLDERDQKAVGR